MTTIAQDEPRRVTGGVDTHKDIHVAAVLDVLGRLVATASFPSPAEPMRYRFLYDNGNPGAASLAVTVPAVDGEHVHVTRVTRGISGSQMLSRLATSYSWAPFVVILVGYTLVQLRYFGTDFGQWDILLLSAWATVAVGLAAAQTLSGRLHHTLVRVADRGALDVSDATLDDVFERLRARAAERVAMHGRVHTCDGARHHPSPRRSSSGGSATAGAPPTPDSYRARASPEGCGFRTGARATEPAIRDVGWIVASDNTNEGIDREADIVNQGLEPEVLLSRVKRDQPGIQKHWRGPVSRNVYRADPSPRRLPAAADMAFLKERIGHSRTTAPDAAWERRMRHGSQLLE